MNTQEFSDQFEVLFSNVTNNQAPGLTEYEKSVLLTKAQDQLVNEYFNVRTDGAGGGYDGNQRRQYDFSSLVKVDTLQQIAVDEFSKLDKRSKVFLFPEDYFLSVNELISDSKYQYTVIPLDYTEYARLMMKPYAYPVKKGAWRIFTNKAVSLLHSETSEGYVIDTYLPKDYTIKVVCVRPIRLNAVETTGVDLGFPESEVDSYGWKRAIISGQRNYAFNASQKAIGITTLSSDALRGEPFALHAEIENQQYTLTVYLRTDSHTDSHIIDMLNIASECVHEAYLAGTINENSTLFKAVKNIIFDKISDSAIYSSTELIPPSQNVADAVAKMFSLTTATASRWQTKAEVILRNAGDLHYQLRYIKAPTPIILTDLWSDGDTTLTIKGRHNITQCELPEEMHQEILERAVTLAKIAWQGGTATMAVAQNKNNE